MRRKTQKIIAIVIAGLLALALILTSISAFAAEFNDVSGHWGEAEIADAANRGIINGDGTGAFRPNDTVTRAEYVKMLSAVLVKYYGENDVPEEFKSEDTWYSKYYNFAKSYYLMRDQENTVQGVNPGVLTADDATAPISRWEMAYMAGSLLNLRLEKEVTQIALFSDSAEVESLPGLIPYSIKLSAENSIIKGNGRGEFNPYGTGSRAEATVMALRVDNAITQYVEEMEKEQQEALEEMNKEYKDNKITYKDSEIPTSNVKVKFTMENNETFVVELYPKEAPQTVANFVSLVKNGFYDGLKFHRILDGFVAQGGDPSGDGTGGSGKYIFGEFSANGFEQNTLTHKAGTISMARSDVSYDSASSQFFICYEAQPSLDGSYAAFGQVIEGMDTVKNFLEVERVTSAYGEPSVPKTDIIIKNAVIVK